MPDPPPGTDHRDPSSLTSVNTEITKRHAINPEPHHRALASYPTCRQQQPVSAQAKTLKTTQGCSRHGHAGTPVSPRPRHDPTHRTPRAGIRPRSPLPKCQNTKYRSDGDQSTGYEKPAEHRNVQARIWTMNEAMGRRPIGAQARNEWVNGRLTARGMGGNCLIGKGTQPLQEIGMTGENIDLNPARQSLR